VFHDYRLKGREEFPFVVDGTTHYQHLERNNDKS